MGRPSLRFDGRGVNGPDAAGTRIANFTSIELAKEYGPRFARLLQMESALRVFTLDERILAWLKEHDPKALEQARHALEDSPGPLAGPVDAEIIPKKELLSRAHPFVQVIFIRAITMLGKEAGDEVVAAVADRDDVAVRLTVDGVAVPLLKALTTLDACYEEEIERRALELVRERFGEAIEKIERAAEDAIKDINKKG